MAKAAVRYGAELRKRAAAVNKSRTSRYACPRCGKKSVKRRGNSLWECRSCGAKFAGGAYSLSTAVGDTIKRTVDVLKKGGKVEVEEIIEKVSADVQVPEMQKSD